MKKEDIPFYKFDSLSEAHRTFGLPLPKHPLISIVNGIDEKIFLELGPHLHALSFFKISFRPYFGGKLKYGQTYFDFDEGGLLFAAPNQIIGKSEEELNAIPQGTCANQQIILLIHPDFLWNFPLAKKIKQYSFFSYSSREALHLSDEEKEVILSIFRMIESELNNRIDEFSQEVVISQLELLLNYANRFYKRQFITRKPVCHDMLQQLEELLDTYFNQQASLNQGIPTVKFLADQLNISPSYLSDMLRSLTGQNAQQLIHQKLIEKAKEKLSLTNLTISEIAYELGFEHPQSFSKLFKNKTQESPMEFREKFKLSFSQN